MFNALDQVYLSEYYASLLFEDLLMSGTSGLKTCAAPLLQLFTCTLFEDL